MISEAKTSNGAVQTEFECKECGRTVYGGEDFREAIAEIQILGWKILWPTRDERGGYLCPEHTGDGEAA